MTQRLFEGIGKIIYSTKFPYCCIALFFLFKLTHLSIPYFWDELGVYTRASLYMFDNEIRILPGNIPPELSRGHPLLCAALFAAAYKLLGPNVWAGHLTALVVSILLLLVVYKGGKKLSNRETGLTACALLMLQPVFIAQSSMVLPEVLLALFSTMAIFAYIGNRLALFALFASFAIMTKETAIAIPVTIWSVEALRWLLGRKAEAVKSVVAGFAPVVCWVGFLLLQKHAHGWFFFPLHTDYISFSIDQIISRWSYYVSFMLKGQGRFLWTIILAFALLLYLMNQRKRSDGRVFEIIRIALADKRPILVLWVFICWGLVVSMLNFHLGRYSLFLFPSLCFLVAQSFFYVLEIIKNEYLKLAAIAMLLFMPLSSFASKVFNFDADMGFQDVVKVNALTADFINENYKSGTVIMDSFPVDLCLMEARAGYNSKKYHHLNKPCTSPAKVDADLFIYSFPGNLENCVPQTDGLTLLKEFKSSFAKVLIYKKK